jgi:hypothetical protein
MYKFTRAEVAPAGIRLREKMAAIAVICTAGSSDGIGHATAPVPVAGGHRVPIGARNRDRGRPVLETTLVTGGPGPT